MHTGVQDRFGLGPGRHFRQQHFVFDVRIPNQHGPRHGLPRIAQTETHVAHLPASQPTSSVQFGQNDAHFLYRKGFHFVVVVIIILRGNNRNAIRFLQRPRHDLHRAIDAAIVVPGINHLGAQDRFVVIVVVRQRLRRGHALANGVQHLSDPNAAPRRREQNVVRVVAIVQPLANGQGHVNGSGRGQVDFGQCNEQFGWIGQRLRFVHHAARLRLDALRGVQ